MRRTLSVCLSVCLSVRPVRGSSFVIFVLFYFFTVEPSYERTSKIDAYGPASRMYFSARTEGRISYGHLGRTNLFYLGHMNLTTSSALLPLCAVSRGGAEMKGQVC